MSTAIDSITIGGIEDRRLVLTNSSAARIINIGTSWSTLRIGIRMCCEDTGADYPNTTRFYFGAMSNPDSTLSNGPLTATCSHFVGFICDSNPNAGYPRRIAGPPVQYTLNSDRHYAKKVVNTITSAAGTNMNARWSINGATPPRVVMMVELVKGSPNFTINFLAQGAGYNGSADVLKGTFLTAMAQTTLANAATAMNSAGNNYGGGNTATLAVSEAVDGFLDAIVVGMDKPIGLYISDIAWFKVS